MTVAAAGLRLPSAWLAAAAALCCLLVGVAAGVNPQYGVLAAVGLVLAGVVIADVTIGYVLFTIASFLDVLSASGSFSGTKVIGMIVAGSWLAQMATRKHVRLRSFIADNRALTISMVGLLTWAAISFAWAQYPGTALGGAGRYALEMVLLPMGYAAMRERRHLVWVVGAFAFGALFSALYGFAHPTAATSGFSGRLTGTIGDPNAEATVMAAALPLVLGLIAAARGSARARLIGGVCMLLLFVGLVTTVSREGILALGAVLVAAVVFGGRWRGRASALLLVAGVLTVGYFFVLAPLSARQRITSSSSSGRTSIWTVAGRVVAAHPIFGVGTDNFILVERQYVGQPGLVNALYLIREPKVAHNTYLEALVDLGIPGAAATILVLAIPLVAAIRAAWMFERFGQTDMELLARTVVLALVAVYAASFFVSNQYLKSLWILLALGPVLHRLARDATPRVVLRPVDRVAPDGRSLASGAPG